MGDNAKSYGGMYGLASQALQAGATLRSQSHLEWDVSGLCEHPKVFELTARPDTRPNPVLNKLPSDWRKPFRDSGLVPNLPTQRGFSWDPGNNGMLWVSLTVRCRRCEWCLRQRARLWARKAQAEIELAPRSWFCTYTGSPDSHFRWLSIARNTCDNRSLVFEQLSPADQFRELVAAAGPDITRYVKRVRKESSARLRYLFVAERHESGLPHWHALVHEVNPEQAVRKSVLKGQWPYGFSRFKLTEDKATAWYLCKYLSKDLATRVRSSLNYGSGGVPATTVFSHSSDLSERGNMTPKRTRVLGLTEGS